MASLKSLVRDKLSQLVFKELVVEAVRDVTPHFRRLELSGPWLGHASCRPGDKLQIMIPEAGPRTYTPFAHDRAACRLELFAYVHGHAHATEPLTPAAAWVRNAERGQQLRAFGPRSSLPLSSMDGCVVFVGDETSFAAAASLFSSRAQHDQLAFVFESTHVDEAEQALADLGVPAHHLVPRRSGQADPDALDSAVRAALTSLPGAQLVLTGHAQTIQALRTRLKQEPRQYAAQKVKAYWADGKRGLD